MLARHLAARRLVLHGKRVQGVGQIGRIGQLLERLVVVTDAGRLVVTQVSTFLLCLDRLPAQAQQGRLAAAVGAQQGDPVARFQPQLAHLEQQRRGRYGAHLQPIERQQLVGRQRLAAQDQAPGRAIADERLFLLQLVDAPLHALGLARHADVIVDLAPQGQAGAADGQAVDFLLFGRMSGGSGKIGFGQRRQRRAARQVEIVQPAIAQDPAARGHIVEQALVVRDEDEGAAPAQQELLQPQQRWQIQVIARFIEQQHVRFLQQGTPQQQPRVLAAGQGMHGHVRRLDVKAQFGQQAVDPPMQFRLLQHGRQQGVVQAQAGKFGRQMLLHMLQAAGTGIVDGTGSRFAGAAEQAQQGGFAATIVADQADAVALAQGKGEFIEEETVVGIQL